MIVRTKLSVWLEYAWEVEGASRLGGVDLNFGPEDISWVFSGPQMCGSNSGREQ